MDENYRHEELEAIVTRLPAQTLRSRILLNVGVDAFLAGNLTLAEAAFQESIRTAEDSVTRNTGRLYLATVYCFRHHPGRFEDEHETAANAKLLDDAETLYREVLADNPTPEHRDAADKSLAAVQIPRQPPPTW